MQFHRYLEQLWGSKVSISLVRTLLHYRGKIFTVRKLAEAAGVSSSEAAVVVQHLEKEGLLRLQPAGKSYLVSLNERNYALSKIIKPMIKAEQETYAELVSILKKHFERGRGAIISAVVFGSVSKGEEKEDSDVDLLVISKDFDSATAIVSKAQEEVSLIFNSRLSPMILSEKELRAKKRDRLVRSIISSHTTVAGEDLKELIERK